MDWLIAWWIGWLNDWVSAWTDWLMVWLIDGWVFDGWLSDRRIDCSNVWQMIDGWLTVWQEDWLMEWLIRRLISGAFTDWLMVGTIDRWVFDDWLSDRRIDCLHVWQMIDWGLTVWQEDWLLARLTDDWLVIDCLAGGLIDGVVNKTVDQLCFYGLVDGWDEWQMSVGWLIVW